VAARKENIKFRPRLWTWLAFQGFVNSFFWNVADVQNQAEFLFATSLESLHVGLVTAELGANSPCVDSNDCEKTQSKMGLNGWRAGWAFTWRGQ
jgi:hypothetical protein